MPCQIIRKDLDDTALGGDGSPGYHQYSKESRMPDQHRNSTYRNPFTEWQRRVLQDYAAYQQYGSSVVDFDHINAIETTGHVVEKEPTSSSPALPEQAQFTPDTHR